MSETPLRKSLMAYANSKNCLLMVNNSGGLQDKSGRVVYYGLGNEGKDKSIGSSDLIGPMPVLIRPEHVGRTFGLFVAAEIKLPGWTHPKDERERRQLNFIAAMNAAGCRAGIVTTPESLDNLLRF